MRLLSKTGALLHAKVDDGLGAGDFLGGGIAFKPEGSTVGQAKDDAGHGWKKVLMPREELLFLPRQS